MVHVIVVYTGCYCTQEEEALRFIFIHNVGVLFGKVRCLTKISSSSSRSIYSGSSIVVVVVAVVVFVVVV